MQVKFTDRTNQPGNSLDGLFALNSMRWGLPGGARDAELAYSGGDIREHLEILLEGLGYGVDILDDSGQVVWNGFVNSIEVQLGKVGMSLSLDQFANRVAIRYVDLKPTVPWSREDGITDFVEDGVRVSQFGKKEWIAFLPNGTPEQALNAAQTWLKQKAEIQKKLVLKGNECEKVVYHLKGWWETLGWIYYQQEEGFVGNLKEGKTDCLVGDTTATQKVAQKFIVPAGGIKTKEIWLRVAAKEKPLDNLVVEIVADAGGSPGGSVLCSGSVVGSGLSGGYNWIRFGVGAVSLNAGGAYWLLVRRTGSVSALNYYLLATDDAMGYAGGEMKAWNGSGWVVRNEDLNFAVLGSEETNEQIKRMVGVGGQFLNGIRIKESSGVQYLLWRELKLSCKEEIENLLQVGAVDGRKLDAMVDAQRNLVVWRRVETVDWRMDRKGRLRSKNGVVWNPAMEWLGGLAETEFGEVVRLDRWEWRG
jgi:hypothetical protein